MSTDPSSRSTCALLIRIAAAALAAGLGTSAAAQVMDSEIHWFALVDQLEVAPGGDGTPLSLSSIGWVGGDVNRVWVRIEGDTETERAGGAVQAEAFFGRLVSPYWDALVGAQVDHRWGGGSATRAQLALGLEGLAPYWFELAPTLYVSQDGDVSGQLEAEYELLVTQRLVLQPRLELLVAAQEVPEFGVGSGFSDLELGARLRFEIRRELAPYVGFAWHRRLGDTAKLARAAGEDVSTASLVAGVRVWY